jgi:hypothetical protein
MNKKWVKITHRESQAIIAEGPLGWGITPFEGNYYIGSRYLKTAGFKANYRPGLCPYKFLYVWLDFEAPNDSVIKNLGWKYWLPNPLLPFIWFRVAIPKYHPEITVVESTNIS